MTLRLNPWQVHYGKTGKCADWGERYSSEDKEHVWLTSLPIQEDCVIVSNVCVKYSYQPVYVNMCVMNNGVTRINNTESYGQRSVLLHFPMQPNLSQRTKSSQIRPDSYHSVSSPQTCQLHGGKDYAKGADDSPISWLWGSLRDCLTYQTCSDVSLPTHPQTPQQEQMLG